MKSDELYEELKDLAARLGISVNEQNFKRLGVKAKSGFCIVRGKPTFIIDKKNALSEKIEVLAEHLGEIPNDNIYIIPAVRELIHKLRRKKQKGYNEA
jgi:hypothetical protein